jgi:hypothetical protein
MTKDQAIKKAYDEINMPKNGQSFVPYKKENVSYNVTVRAIELFVACMKSKNKKK